MSQATGCDTGRGPPRDPLALGIRYPTKAETCGEDRAVSPGFPDEGFCRPSAPRAPVCHTPLLPRACSRAAAHQLAAPWEGVIPESEADMAQAGRAGSPQEAGLGAFPYALTVRGQPSSNPRAAGGASAGRGSLAVALPLRA